MKQTETKHGYCRLACLLALAHTTLHAAEPGVQGPSKELETLTVVGSKEEPSYNVKRTSTATKTDTPLIDTPQAVTVPR